MPPSNCDSQLSIRSITVVNNFVTNCALNTHWNLLKEITQESNKKFMHVLHTKKNLIVRTVLMMMLEKSTDNFVMSCKWAREDEKIFGKQVNKVFVAAAFLSQFYESLKYIFYGTLHFAAFLVWDFLVWNLLIWDLLVWEEFIKELSRTSSRKYCEISFI